MKIGRPLARGLRKAAQAGGVVPHAAPPVPSKYRNKAVVVDGERFASKAEAKRHQELLILQRAGEIHYLERQPRYELKVGDEVICTYVGDWSYTTADWQDVVEDKKGFQTPEFKLKARLFRALYPHIELRLT